MQLLLSTSLSVSGNEKDVLAILTLEAKGVSQKGVSTIMAEIARHFSTDTSFIVLEDEIIQLMLKEQGFDRSATCSNLQCYTGIGHLLTASNVIGGTVTFKADKTITLTLGFVDVAGSEMICEETARVFSISALMQIELPRITKVMMEKYHKGKNFAIPIAKRTDTNTKKRKSPLLRPLGWLATGALLAGGGALAYYKYIRPSDESTGSPSTSEQPVIASDIPTGDVPVHGR